MWTKAGEPQAGTSHLVGALGRKLCWERLKEVRGRTVEMHEKRRDSHFTNAN